MTSLMVSPDTPSSSRASCTSWSRSGRMIASIFFICCLALLSAGGHSDRHRSRRGPPGRRRGRVVLGARHRHELLGVSPHAVLDDVEAVALLLGLDPQAV